VKVFCPNCGSENEGHSGGRVVCRACTATFEVPAERFADSGRVVDAPAVHVATPSASPSAQAPMYSAPIASVPQMQGQAATTNVLAIVSLVTSLLCCSPAGLITGFIGLQQINQSNGTQKGKELAIIGIVIGALGLCSSTLYIIGAVVGAAR